jgi:subtilisin family serine protease
MKKRFITLSLALLSFGVMNFFYGQEKAEIVNWYNGKSPGMNTEKAYSALKKRKSTTVIVAVIDSGIDIEHKDLQGKIWLNEDEIPNNGIDDDKNGYIDDMHGWNFLGSATGENQKYARLEKTRLLAQLEERFKGKESSQVAAADRADYELYKRLNREINDERKGNLETLEQYKQIGEMLPVIKAKLIEKLGADFTVQDVENWKPASPEEMQMKQLGAYIASGELTEAAIQEAIDHFDASANYQLNTQYDDRMYIGDNPHDFNDVHYGNNDVEGPDALHGTHVGGIIGAVRGNGLGGDGVADNVKLMSLRAVPDGDEQDKDVALAIRYAVDNGAMVINMSFGKSVSMHQQEVYDALAYADSKGVLLIHASGNDGANVDEADNFPSSSYSFQKTKLGHYITIGASTRYPKGKLAADFSNYGQTKVDVLAPGLEIYSTVPQSDYKTIQGTSMAAPMVTGVAAMLKSYFPTLTMLQIKEAILSSAKSYKGTQQMMPGSEQMVDFGTLSVTGGVVDVSAAVKACMKLEAKK